MEKLIDTVMSQFANSPKMMSLISALNDAIDPSADVDAFYEMVWNIDTAQGYGLQLWGRIVGVSDVLTVAGGKNVGFDEAGAVSGDPFGQSAFYAGEPSTSNYVLAPDSFRQLILIKALANISNCAIPTYNVILMQLFEGRGNAYVTDTGNMSARLNFEFLLTDVEIAILKQSGAFAPPTGVRFDILNLDIETTFGFAEAGAKSVGFGQGILFDGYA